MRGHLPIIAMRRRGAAPSTVTLSDTRMDAWCWRDWPEFMPHAQVQVEPADAPRRLDLRFVVGMTVFVDGYNANRVNALADAAERAGADRVIRVVLKTERLEPAVQSWGDSLHPSNNFNDEVVANG